MSKIGWVNFDRNEQDRVQELINALAEPGTVDDLGLGAIRDTIADHLFPGVSTIQTRLRYFILVPRIIAGGADKFSGDPSEWMRDRELDLIARFLENEELRAEENLDWTGLFGRASKKELKRRPSAVYWGGLKEWGILEQNLSISEAVEATKRSVSVPSSDEAAIFQDELWKPDLPDLKLKPEGQHESLVLSRAEAEFLKGRVRDGHNASVLSWVFDHAETLEFRGDVLPWDALRHENLSAGLREDLDQAERFSTLMHGAQLLHNLMLSRHFEAGREENVAKYEDALEQWFKDAGRKLSDLKAGDPLWPFPDEPRHKIPDPAKAFVRDWREIGLRDPFGDAARDLVRARETQVKKSNAKLKKPPSDEWGGNSGASQLSFRWGNVVRFVQDLKDAR